LFNKLLLPTPEEPTIIILNVWDGLGELLLGFIIFLGFYYVGMVFYLLLVCYLIFVLFIEEMQKKLYNNIT
jgi:hypothetical protein